MKALCIAMLGIACLAWPATVAAEDGTDEPPLGHPEYTASRERPFGWRGDGSGLFPGADPPTRWDLETGQNVLWTAELPGWAHGSPVLAGDKVITVSQPQWIICHDKMTGKELWRRDVGYGVLGEEFADRRWPRNQFVKEEYGYTCPTPVTDGRHIWYSFGHGALVCLDLDGNIIWAATFPTETKQRSGISQSPCLAGDVVVMGAAAEYAFAGFDAATGKRLWRVPRGGGSRGKGNFQTIRMDGKPYALVSDGIIFDPETGRILQDRMLAPDGGRSYGPTPVFDPQTKTAFLINTNARELVATPVKLDGGSQERRWTARTPKLVQKSPLHHNGLVYVIKGSLNVHDAKTGEVVYTRPRFADGYPSPSLGGKYIYVLPSGKPGDAIVFESGREYRETARFKMHFAAKTGGNKGQLGASPVFDGNRIYHRDGERLYCFAPNEPGKTIRHGAVGEADGDQGAEKRPPHIVAQARDHPAKLVPLLKHEHLAVRLAARRQFASLILPGASSDGVRLYTPVDDATPIDSEESTKGLPVNLFTHDVAPKDWLVCGPFPGFVPRRDCLASIGGSASALPRVGTSVKFRGRTERFRELSPDSFWRHPHFTQDRRSIDLTHALVREYFSSGTLFCVIRNDRSRRVAFRFTLDPANRQPSQDGLDGKAWLGGVPIDGDIAVRLEPGLYPLVVQFAIGWTQPWGKIYALPRLVEVDESLLLTDERRQARQRQLKAIAPHVRRALRDEHWHSRYHALWILSRLGPEAGYFHDDVSRALSDDTNDVVMLACGVIAAIDQPEARDVRMLLGLLDGTFCDRPAAVALASLLREPREDLGEAASPVAERLFAADGNLQNQLAGLAVRAGVDVPFGRCVKEYRENPRTKWPFMTQMLEYGGFASEQAVPFAAGELRRGAKVYDSRHLRQLCRALVHYGSDAAPAVPDVIPLLRQEDHGLREAAIDLVGAIGPAASDAVPELERQASSTVKEERSLREAAAKALMRIRTAASRPQ